jgi:phosphoribosylformimino-5-aminoimidazole carboxamide ribotide isomerase
VIVLPAIDLREGACVQLVGGDYAAERVRLPDPVAVRDEWVAAGYGELHVVDLDAATGRGGNAEVVGRLLAPGGNGRPAPVVQVGGGLDATEKVAALIARGAARVVVGTRAIEDPAWLADLARRYPGRVVVAADVREREVVTKGWARSSGRDVVDLLRTLEPLPLGGVLVTAVHREGRLAGPDLALTELVAGATRHPVQASGGIRDLADLRALASAGAARAVVGMAFYTGALDRAAVLQEFPS